VVRADGGVRGVMEHAGARCRLTYSGSSSPP
jgi:hypothetical protein